MSEASGHIYHDLPAELRGSVLESRSGWPRIWTAPDTETALQVAVALIDTFNRGGVGLSNIDLFSLCTITDEDGTRIILNRKDASAWQEDK
jgi:hypothetical protein